MTAALIGVIILLCLAFFGLPLGMALMSVGVLGFSAVHPKGILPAVSVAGQQVLDLALNIEFAVLPMFILMGVFITRAALSDELYDAAHKWLGHFRGGLAMSTVAACGGLAAVSGPPRATAATMTKVAVPSMRKYKYSDAMAAGTVAAGGTMGILIPPSAALIIYGLLTQEDIAQLFMAGVIPGIITILLYIAAIKITAYAFPKSAPATPKASWGERFSVLTKVWGVLFLFLLIMGGIFFGIFTSGEAGGIGAGGALIFATIRGKMNLRILYESLVEAARTTGMLFFVAFGALVFNQFVNMSGMPNQILDFLTGMNLSPMGVVVLIMIFYVIMGMFIEGMAMIFLTVPVFYPLMASMGMDIVWWGIITVVVVEISLITPPMGLNVFVIKAMIPDVDLKEIFKGITPFFIADILRLIVFLAFPITVMWLPRFMASF